MSGLAKFYDEIICSGLKIAINPFRSPILRLPKNARVPQKQADPLTYSDAKRILSVAEELTREGDEKEIRNFAILNALLGLGIRRSGVLAIRGCDIKQVGDIWKVVLFGGKNSVKQELPLPPWAVEPILKWRTISGIGNSQMPLFKLSTVAVHNIFKKYLRLAGLDTKLSLHSCRTTLVNYLLDQGWAHADIQNVTGHKNVSTVEIYDRRKRQIEQNPLLKLKKYD